VVAKFHSSLIPTVAPRPGSEDRLGTMTQLFPKCCDTLGHSSIRVTKDVYGHLLASSKMKAAEAHAQDVVAR
jgi:hypothetical protein